VFHNYADELSDEFNKYTDKNIKIEYNNYYNNYINTNLNGNGNQIDTKNKIYEVAKEPTLNTLSLLRSKIQSVILSLCVVENFDYWGNVDSSKTFTLHKKITYDEIESIFKNLREVITNHIFESELSADIVFLRLNEIKNIYPISLETLQNALALYEDIMKNYPNYLPQFFNAAVSIFNKSYEEYNPFPDTYDLPF
jgi:hypothetical protein